MLKPKDIDVAYRYLRGKVSADPAVAVVLGSGIPGPRVDVEAEVGFDELPYCASATAEGHRGVLVFGRHGDVPVVVSEGRLHPFEGHPPDVLALPVRLFGRLGCRTLILTGAVGALHAGFGAGDVVVLRDHINLLNASPLAGPHVEEYGPRFVATADAYDAGLRARAAEVGRNLSLELKEAVYAAVPGPQYETGAEVRALATLGGDVVGMSVPGEVLVARQLGLRVLALCAVTNAAGEAGASHSHVLAAAAETGTKIKSLVEALLPTVAAE
ncbi:MAG: purine-nucleoside phosphorylase [Candidatus Zixiibacteriota bacterium]|jgi:purine-nucleoside phosphorylase